MRRRLVLRAMAAAALSPGVPWLAWAAQGPGRPRSRIRPGDPAWPTPSQWKGLEAEVEGHLTAGSAPFAACVRDAASAACAEVGRQMRNPFYIGDQDGGTQICGWLDAWTPAPSAYVVAARNAAHVAAAVNFAREHSLRLAVKGAGHSYQGTSNAADALLIWTRPMSAVTIHDAFTPRGSKAAAGPAVTIEGGAVWIDAYDAVTNKAGRYVQGGGCMDVGVAGLIQSGGFGVHSKRFGAAAGSLLEAEVVTADGQVRTVNAAREPDLFWALKGGGGGSFGVVTRLTLRTHELPDHFGFVSGEVRARSDLAFKALLARFAALYATRLFNPHWGEQVHVGPGKRIEISMASQGLDAAEMRAIWAPFFAEIAAAPQDYEIASPLRMAVQPPRDAWAIANRGFERDPRPGAPAHHVWSRGDQGEVGVFLHGYDSVWLPASLLKTPQALVDGLFAASRLQMVRLFFNKGLAGATDAVLAQALDTAINPAVTEAFALAIVADGEAPAYPGQPGAHVDLEAARRDARAIAGAAEALRRMAPGAGSYVSESNYFNPDWQAAFWGRNYPRLLAVKRKYDPTGLFTVHHGVGSEDWSPDGFHRVRG